MRFVVQGAYKPRFKKRVLVTILHRVAKIDEKTLDKKLWRCYNTKAVCERHIAESHRSKQKIKIFKKSFKNPLTNALKCDKIVKLRKKRIASKESQEKVQKNLKKYLTNSKRCDIIKKLSRKSVKRTSSLKIEQ